MMTKIGLFYASSTCYTEMAAEKIRDTIHALTSSQIVTLHNLATDPIQRMTHYRYLILGIPTWDYGELQEDWENQWEALDSLDLSSSKVALYGLGDQIGYPEWFQDALGYLWVKVVNQGAQTFGRWPNCGYQFEQSKALTADKKFFVGLPLDDENQSDQMHGSIAAWCRQILQEFELL